MANEKTPPPPPPPPPARLIKGSVDHARKAPTQIPPKPVIPPTGKK